MLNTVFICLIALSGFYLTEKLVITKGKSIPYYVFFISNKQPQKEDYVIIKTKENDPIAKGQYITKQIKCMAGDTLLIKERDYYCNGIWIGRAKTHTLKGEPVKNWNPCGAEPCSFVIQDGYFVIGAHKDSYDSKYLGLIGKDVIKVVKPIF